MGLASNPANIRYNGTGRAYVADVGGSGLLDLGEMENLTFSQSVSTEKMKSTRNAARATILEAESERECSLSFGLREMTEENLKIALLGSAVNTQNQAAGSVFQDAPTFADDLYIDLGHLNVFITKVTGAVTGSLAVGDTLTGDASGATCKIAYLGSGYVLLVQLSGTVQVGENLEETPDTNYITVSGVEKLEDVCVTSSDGSALRVNGTDYSVDPDYGYVRKLSAGSIAAGDVVSYDYEAVDRKYLWGLSAGSVEKKFVFVSDKDDRGPRQRWTFHRVRINLDGDFPLIGEGAAILSVGGSVMADTTQPSGQEYYKLEMM